MRMKNQKINGFLALMLVLTGVVILAPILVGVDGATDVSSTGSFTLNAQPTVSDVDFNDDGYGSATSLTPNTIFMRLNFTIGSSATLANIQNVTIWIFDDSTHGANYNTTAVDGILIAEFRWNESDDLWSVTDQGSMSEWAVDSAGSIDPGSSSSQTSYEMSMRFNISMVARADTNDWNASVHIYDDDNEWTWASEAGLLTMNDYFALSFSDSEFSWGSDVQPGSDNNTITAGRTVTFFANTNWEAQINATDFNATGESDVDIEANDILIWDDDNSNGGYSLDVRNTIATMPTGSTWDNQAAMSDESGIVRNFYPFLNPGALFIAGMQWNTSITIWVQANT